MQPWVYVEQGYKAVRLHCAIPGMPTASYATPEAQGRTGDYITDFPGIIPKAEIWDTGRYMRFTPDALADMRARLGPEWHLLHDVPHRLMSREAAQFVKAVEPIGFAGSKTRPQLKPNSACALCASNPSRRSPWAKCSTRFGNATG